MCVCALSLSMLSIGTPVLAHEQNHDEKQSQEILEDVSLEDWEGSWNSFTGYLDEEEVKEAIKFAAEENEESEDEFYKELEEKRQTDFNAMLIKGDEVVFLDKFEEDDGEEIGKGTYDYFDTLTMEHAGHEMHWYVFEGVEEAPYKYMMFMELHGEDTMAHFHIRYGDDLEELKEEESWYPTFVKPSTTIEQIAENIG